MRILPVTLLLLAAPAVLAQTPKRGPETLDARYRRLLVKLDGEQRPSTAERVRELTTFAEAAHKAKNTRLEVTVRLRLARTHLFAFEPGKARSEYERLARLASQGEQRELLGQSLYGQLRCLELNGDRDGCRRLVTRIKKDFSDTRYARMAEIVRKRVSRKRPRLQNGKPTPAFAPRLDLDGKTRSHQQLFGKPALLVFWSPDAASSMAAVQRLSRAWTRAGGTPSQFLAICVHHDRGRVKKTVKQRGWKIPVLVASDDFLDPLLLDYDVRGVPASFLLGPDQSLLGRNVNPGELARKLKILLGK